MSVSSLEPDAQRILSEEGHTIIARTWSIGKFPLVIMIYGFYANLILYFVKNNILQYMLYNTYIAAGCAFFTVVSYYAQRADGDSTLRLLVYDFFSFHSEVFVSTVLGTIVWYLYPTGTIDNVIASAVVLGIVAIVALVFMAAGRGYIMNRAIKLHMAKHPDDSYTEVLHLMEEFQAQDRKAKNIKPLLWGLYMKFPTSEERAKIRPFGDDYVRVAGRRIKATTYPKASFAGSRPPRVEEQRF